MDKYFQIGEVATRTATSVDTIRYYEKLGLLQSHGRSAGGYRQFDEHCVRRVNFIKRSQSLGFSLDEISELLGLADEHDDDMIKLKAGQKIEVIREKREQLERIEAALEEISTCECEEVVECLLETASCEHCQPQL